MGYRITIDNYETNRFSCTPTTIWRCKCNIEWLELKINASMMTNTDRSDWRLKRDEPTDNGINWSITELGVIDVVIVGCVDPKLIRSIAELHDWCCGWSVISSSLRTSISAWYIVSHDRSIRLSSYKHMITVTDHIRSNEKMTATS